LGHQDQITVKRAIGVNIAAPKQRRLEPEIRPELDQGSRRAEKLGNGRGGKQEIRIPIVDGLAGLAVDDQNAPMTVPEARRRQHRLHAVLEGVDWLCPRDS
jgi:hypothetical protein